MVVLETILYFFEGRKAAAPEWIRWSNEKVDPMERHLNDLRFVLTCICSTRIM